MEKNAKEILDVYDIQRDYLSDGQNMNSKPLFNMEKLDVKTPISTCNLKQKKFNVCSSIFPNDEIKFVSKRKKNAQKKKKGKEEILSTDRAKVEVRSCDPCRIF